MAPWLTTLSTAINTIGVPIQAMLDRVKKWLAYGKTVKIMTARVAEENEVDQYALIDAWCMEHLGRTLPITASKDYGMVELWDDRAVRVERNTGAQLSSSDVERMPHAF